jgi:hypothetical protein
MATATPADGTAASTGSMWPVFSRSSGNSPISGLPDAIRSAGGVPPSWSRSPPVSIATDTTWSRENAKLALLVRSETGSCIPVMGGCGTCAAPGRES